MFNDIIQRWSVCVGLNAAEACRVQSDDLVAMVGLGLVAGITILLILKLRRALLILRAKSFTPAFSRLLSSWVKTNDYTGASFFQADGADEPTVARRQQALDRLAAYLQDRHPQSISWGNTIRDSFSDLRLDRKSVV